MKMETPSHWATNTTSSREEWTARCKVQLLSGERGEGGGYTDYRGKKGASRQGSTLSTKMATPLSKVHLLMHLLKLYRTVFTRSYLLITTLHGFVILNMTIHDK